MLWILDPCYQWHGIQGATRTWILDPMGVKEGIYGGQVCGWMLACVVGWVGGWRGVDRGGLTLVKLTIVVLSQLGTAG